MAGNIILALLGGQKVDVHQSRQLRVIKNIKAPIVTEAFVGVCCKQMMKLCTDVRMDILRQREMERTQIRDA